MKWNYQPIVHFFNFCFEIFYFQAKNRRDNELNSLKEEMQAKEKRYQELLNQARIETDMKIQECEELRMHVSFFNLWHYNGITGLS